MDKISVNIILPKNKKSISSKCNLWYIPYCPIDIKDPEDWYYKIQKFINLHSTKYNILHIPNSIYDYTEHEDVRIKYNQEIKDIFVVGIGKDKHLFEFISAVPVGYHIAYCLQDNFAFYKNEKDETDYQIQEMLYDYAAKIMLYIMVILFIGFILFP
jgi:hypothetical protein